MAELSANAAQTIAPGSAWVFTETPVPSTNGFIYHRDGTGVIRLASPARMSSCQNWQWGGCCCKMPEAMYLVSFHGNVAIPTGGTVEEISLAIAIGGDADPSSTMIVTPAAVGEFWNVGAEILVAVPAICACESISVRNTSTQAITGQNANLVVQFQGIQY